MKYTVWVINGGKRVVWKHYSRIGDAIRWGRKTAGQMFDNGEVVGLMLIEIRDIITDDVVKTVEPW